MISRLQGDVLDANRLNHVSGTKLADDVEALERRAKDGIPVIEHVLRTKAEVELRTGGVGVLGTAIASAPSTWLLRGFVSYSCLMR